MDASDIALQNRKFAKTCVEKKRRDRINKCLDELKDLMAQSDDKARYQKMEKAEILEMAVAYMRNIRLNNPNHSFANNNNNNNTSTNDLLYTQVYAKCLSDVQNFVCHLPDIHDEVKTGLIAHLAQLNQTNQTIDELVKTTTTTTTKKTTKSNLVKGSPGKKFKKNSSHDDHDFLNSTNEQRMNQMSIMTNTSCSNSSSSQNVSSSLDSSYYSPYLYHNTNTNVICRNEIMSPALSDSEHVLNHHNESRISNTSSSPSLSQCSSPLSSSSSVTCNNEFRFNGNFELYQSVGFLKMWRPW